MKKHLMTLAVLLFSRFAQKFAFNTFNGNDYKEIAHLKLRLFYLKSIKTFRLLFVSSLGIGVCLIFLLSSLILFPATLFLYAPWSMEAKMWIGLIMALVYLLVAIKAFSYIFEEDRWIDLFQAKDMLKDLEEEAELSQPEQEAWERRKNATI